MKCNRYLKAAAFAGVATGVMLSGTPAMSADQQPKADQAKSDTRWVDIKSWNYEPAYRGWSADELLDEEVYGSNGDEIGEVEDIILGPDGRIRKVVVEGGGFLDIGDSHVAVSWDKVKRFGSSSISVPIAEGNLDQYRLFENEDLNAQQRNFRVRELIGDSVRANGIGYGYVTDVIFNNDGVIESVIVDPAYGYGYGVGPVGMPYYADGYDPYAPYYAVPYSVEQLKDLGRFRYDRLTG